MIIELPGFQFAKRRSTSLPTDLLLNTVRQFLNTKNVDRSHYALGTDVASGFGELVICKVNDFWLVYITERGTNFDATIFSSEFDAVSYFVFQLTGEKETIDWSNIYDLTRMHAPTLQAKIN